MSKKTLIALGYMLGGMLSLYAFGVSKTKLTDIWYLPMAVMIICHGVEKLLEDYNPAEAKVFGKIANACFIFVMAGGVWWLLRQP
ncbi:MAG TPA: hypothetical protein VD886_02725 [Herpetosiphonaceae bacterium]|nr:hypothetical protein [Herpetosiphonaceae bacterium]